MPYSELCVYLASLGDEILSNNEGKILTAGGLEYIRSREGMTLNRAMTSWSYNYIWCRV